ncbi:MAG: iron-sulfur cluster repair di-iron protein [Actinobacteria bacterium]|nr:MAG: iron-sulfur cluster repair di-iron protein [Actinomycetota bacterium]
MTKIDSMMTLGAMVNAHPELAREFERRGLDYCCGGKQTLTDACTSKGIDLTLTVAELTAAVTEEYSTEWSSMEAVELVDHLESTHHRYLWDELPRLSALVAKIVSVHGERHLELGAIATCYEKVRADLEPHLLREERVLFPMIRELAVAQSMPSFHCGSIQNPISMMLREHDMVGGLLAQLRQLTNGFQVPEDACPSYKACFAGLAELEEDTHLHIHKENNLLFPMVVRMEALIV